MWDFILKLLNRRGFPAIKAQSVDLTTDSLTFNFNAHRFINEDFAGGFWVYVDKTFTAPQTAVNVYFNTIGVANSKIPLTTFNGANVTSSTWTGTGVHLCFYNRDTNTLQLIY